jgi:hypothetical protein
MAMLRLHNLSILLVLVILPFGVSGQSDIGADKIVVAKRIVRELFPELKGRGLRVIIADSNSLDSIERGPTAFSLHIFEAVNFAQADTGNCPSFLVEPVNVRAPLTAKCPSFLINVGFMFQVMGDDRISSIGAWGEAVNTDEVTKMNRLVDAHTEWSERDIDDALRKAGAHFGSWAKDDLIHSIPMPAFKQLLEDVEVVSVKFSTRNEQQLQAHLPAAYLAWDVTLISRMKGRRDCRYHAFFEPFQGKLTGLIQLPQ